MAFGSRDKALSRIFLEPMTGIEPAYSAWEVGSLRPPPFQRVRL
jgi:hypothetical protein